MKTLHNKWFHIQECFSIHFSYVDEIVDEKKLDETLIAVLKSEQFLPYANLVASLTQQLNGFYSIEEFVHNINSWHLTNFFIQF